MSKWIFYLLGSIVYPLLVYVVMPYAARHMDVGSTDAAGAGMARAFGYIYGCILWCVVVFVLEMVTEWLLYHSVWRSMVCAAVGLILIWGGHAGYEVWKNNRKYDFTDYYDTGEVERTGRYIGTSDREHGEITTYYRNGGIKSVETFVRGELIGPCKMYYENGNLQSEGRLFGWNRILDGVWKFYRETGVLDDEREYRMGELISSRSYTLFFGENGVIRRIDDREPYTGRLDKTPVVSRNEIPDLYTCDVIAGTIPEGDVVKYYNVAEPVVAATFSYSGGKMNGERRYYYPNTQLKSRCTYRNGKIEGDYTSYYADSVAERPFGAVEYSCFYVDDKRNGVARWYNPDGSLDHEQPHKAGMRVGADTKYFYEEGRNKFSQTLFVNDEELGDLITSADENLNRAQLDICLEGSDPGFIREFEYWRKVDPSWLVMTRSMAPDTLVSRLNTGQACEGCYALLREKVLPCGAMLPEKLPEDETCVPVLFPAGCEAQSAAVCNRSYRNWEITVEYPRQTKIYELSDACIGSWFKVTILNKK